MILATILLAAFASTSLMTAFSYMVSAAFGALYKEPLLLQYLMTRFHFGLYGTWKVMAGWAVHYLIGLLFVAAYYVLWQLNAIDINWISTLLFGIFIGIIGIGGWVLMFNLSNYQPKIDFKGYYFQLFFAHLVFALTTFVTFWLLLQ